MEILLKIIFIITFYFTILRFFTHIKLFETKLYNIDEALQFKKNYFWLFLNWFMWFYQIYFWFNYFNII